MTVCACHRDSVPCVTRIPFSGPNQADTDTGRDIGHSEHSSRKSGTISVSPQTFWLTSRHTYGVIMVTHMARRRSDAAGDPKVAALRAAGALHPHPEAVHDDAFVQHPFFDPRDRVQVKYEMLRRHRVDGQPVTQVAARFSISRQAFYEAATAFNDMGLPGLVPKRPGPKRAHKCTGRDSRLCRTMAGRGAGAIGGASRHRRHAAVSRHDSSALIATRARPSQKKRHAPETRR